LNPHELASFRSANSLESIDYVRLALRAELAVNIFPEGGSIVTFVDARQTKKEFLDPSARLAPEWHYYTR
jgi:hypothetical protein